MKLVKSFQPIASPNAKLLILGTAPSITSLEQQQYYAHPRNAFWPILGQLFNFDAAISYPQRKTQLVLKCIALWDVMLSCQRHLSADSSIQPNQFNDFDKFFEVHSQLKAIFFNGQMAQKLFLKQLAQPKNTTYHTLPSTSPANARLQFAEKLYAWKAVKDCLENQQQLAGTAQIH